MHSAIDIARRVAQRVGQLVAGQDLRMENGKSPTCSPKRQFIATARRLMICGTKKGSGALR